MTERRRAAFATMLLGVVVSASGSAATLTTPPAALAVLINASAGDDQLHAGASCSGVLVAPSLVLTAAHCVHERAAGSLHVALGPQDICGTDPVIGERLAVRRIHVHPQARTERYVDAALLELATSASATPIRGAAKQDGRPVTAFGFGRPSEFGAPPCRPRATALRTVPLQSCQAAADAARRDLVVGDHVCTLPTGRANTCIGDSGGPLVRDGRLVAIVSWGPGCGPRDVGVNVDGAALSGWVDSVTAARSGTD